LVDYYRLVWEVSLGRTHPSYETRLWTMIGQRHLTAPLTSPFSTIFLPSTGGKTKLGCTTLRNGFPSPLSIGFGLRRGLDLEVWRCVRVARRQKQRRGSMCSLSWYMAQIDWPAWVTLFWAVGIYGSPWRVRARHDALGGLFSISAGLTTRRQMAFLLSSLTILW
jgi:hypothetical protein